MSQSLNTTDFIDDSDDNSLISGGYITVQGVTGVLPRYYNTHLTVIDSKVTINAAKDSFIDIKASAYTKDYDTQINNAQNTVVTAGQNVYRMVANKGSNNVYNTRSALYLNDATGNNTINAALGNIGIWGSKDATADDLNLTLNANGSAAFTAGNGNETLDGSASKGRIQVFGGYGNLVASTGGGNDTFYGGKGNCTFTGGSGNNLFKFNKYQANNGNTVITDFYKSNSNKINIQSYQGEFNVQTILDNAYNTFKVDSENKAHVYATIDLGNSKIELQDVAASLLRPEQFLIT